MKAIILAAGRGSRMGALTDEQPKCLTVVKGKPLIEHQISALKEAGIDEIGMVTGYKADYLNKYNTKKFHNSRWSETNMFYSLLCARDWLNQDDCIVSYSDIFYLPQVVKSLIACKDEIAIAYDPNWLELWSKRFEDPLDDAETFRIDENGYLLEIGQKPSTVDEIQGQYMGLLKFGKGVWNDEAFLEWETVDMTSALQRMLNIKKAIFAIPNLYVWGEIDSPGDVDVIG